MTNTNPYAELTAPPAAAFAAASERAAFLKRVYGILFLGILGFAATLWAAGNVAPVNRLAVALGQLIYQGRFGSLFYIGIFMLGSWGVNALAEKKPINVVAYATWVFLLGLLVAPIVLFLNSGPRGPELISQASAITAALFGGMTLFVLWTGAKLTFLRGALAVAGLGLFLVMIAGWLFGFTPGLWWIGGLVVVTAGYILYYTSEILHRFPTNMAMSAAIILFTEVVLLFKYVLVFLARSRD